MTPKIRLGIVEDKLSLVKNLELYFAASEHVQLVFTEDRLEPLAHLCTTLTPDIVLMDVDLGAFTGMDGLLSIRQTHPSVKVLMFTVIDDEATLFEAIANGADGYILKDTPLEQLEHSIIETYKGGSVISPLLTSRLLHVFRQNSMAQNALTILTPRENDILKHLVKGYSYKQVATALGISLGTVRSHIENIYSKLGVNSKAEAVAKFLNGSR
ncbi:LuxR C-terminal-related transcriptional regulator [Pontibacter oryzae]|uniref:DNA-binding response regulator n=1 Tax=Pontibacter oryzae TaxID=2304593 RepID=A0A399SIJ0_9BACT|nr:response regulator transcription factor [Pontibacter oryzae]RIJ42709.1 DNA-binding response regulator [Pontibacter oryzae]